MNYEYENRNIRIEQSECAESPREDCDNFCTLVLFGEARHLGDTHELDSSDYSGWDELQAAVEKEFLGGIVEPIYLFDHSGVTISTSDEMFRAMDSKGWDWGQVGFAAVSAESIRECYGVKRVTKAIRAKAEAVLEAEVKEYDQYLRGEVYDAIIEDEDGNELDAIHGIVGFEWAKEAAEEAVRGLPPIVSEESSQ